MKQTYFQRQKAIGAKINITKLVDSGVDQIDQCGYMLIYNFSGNVKIGTLESFAFEFIRIIIQNKNLKGFSSLLPWSHEALRTT
jgi:hypothetical protein